MVTALAKWMAPFHLFDPFPSTQPTKQRLLTPLLLTPLFLTSVVIDNCEAATVGCPLSW